MKIFVGLKWDTYSIAVGVPFTIYGNLRRFKEKEA
jgi:hypothetical protein